MVAALVLTPASGSITAVKTAVKISVTGGSANDLTAYNSALYPSSPEIKQYIRATATGQPTLKSHVFTPATGGTAEWNGVIFPAAGSWTVTLRKASDDTQLATASITVS